MQQKKIELTEKMMEVEGRDMDMDDKMERFGREDFGPFIKGVESGIQIPLQIHKFPYYSYSRGQARRRSQEHDRRRSQKLLQARRVCHFLTVMSFF